MLLPLSLSLLICCRSCRLVSLMQLRVIVCASQVAVAQPQTKQRSAIVSVRREARRWSSLFHHCYIVFHGPCSTGEWRHAKAECGRESSHVELCKFNG
jgi:hypothetical protein